MLIQTIIVKLFKKIIDKELILKLWDEFPYKLHIIIAGISFAMGKYLSDCFLF